MSNLFTGSLVAILCVGLFALALDNIEEILIVQYARKKTEGTGSHIVNNFDFKVFMVYNLLRYMGPFTIYLLEEPFTIKRVKQKKNL